MAQENPLNDIPPAVAGLTVLIAGVEAIMQLASAGVLAGAEGVGWRSASVNDFAFFPAVQAEMFAHGDFAPGYLWRYVTYPFVHASLTHALFAGAIVLALGKFVGDRWHWASLLTVFFAAAIATAMTFGLIAPENWPLYGAYPAIYGLIGAFSWMMWVRLGQTGGNRWRAFGLIGMLLAVQIIWGVALRLMALVGLMGDPTPMVLYMGLSELVGFVVGLALSPVLGPGGWAATLDRLRRR